MSIKNGTTLTPEALSYLVGLIRDISGLDTKLIDDLNIKSNGSYSSLKISQLVDQALKDSKDYADLLCSSLIKLTCEKTTTQPTLSNSEKNVIYLYSADGNAPFDQYLKISDTELIDMGSTSINLNDYLTITDAVANYCKKTDFDALKTVLTTHTSDTDIHTSTTEKDTWNTVTDKASKSDLTTHTSDTDIHITTAERTKWNKVDNKVNKTDIIDNLTSTNTDKPLSAKQGKVLKGEVDKKANDDEVIKKTAITTTINSKSTDTQVPSAKAIYDKYNKLDKNVTIFTLSAPSGMVISNSSSYYCITNGICFVSIAFTCTTASSIAWKTFAIGLPKSKLQCHLCFPSSDSGGSPLYMILTTGGIVTIYLGNSVTIGTTYHATFSYPVSES